MLGNEAMMGCEVLPTILTPNRYTAASLDKRHPHLCFPAGTRAVSLRGDLRLDCMLGLNNPLHCTSESPDFSTF